MAQACQPVVQPYLGRTSEALRDGHQFSDWALLGLHRFEEGGDVLGGDLAILLRSGREQVVAALEVGPGGGVIRRELQGRAVGLAGVLEMQLRLQEIGPGDEDVGIGRVQLEGVGDGVERFLELTFQDEVLGLREEGGSGGAQAIEGPVGIPGFAVRVGRLPGGGAGGHEEGQRHGAGRRELSPVASGELAELVGHGRCGGGHRLVVEEALDVEGEGVGGLVSAKAVLLEGLHHDPVEVAAEGSSQAGGIDAVAGGHGGALGAFEGRHARGGPGRIDLADHAAHLVVTGAEEGLGIERRCPREELVKDARPASRCRSGCRHRGRSRRPAPARCRVRRPDELLEAREEGLVGEALLGGLGDSEVDDLGHGAVAVQGHEDVGGLEIAVNDALLVGVAHGRADVEKEGEALQAGVVLLLVAEADESGRPSPAPSRSTGGPPGWRRRR